MSDIVIVAMDGERVLCGVHSTGLLYFPRSSPETIDMSLGFFFIVFVVVNLFFLHFFSVREAFWSDTRRVGIVRAAVGSHNCVYKYDFTASQTCCRAIVNKTVNKHAVVT